MQRMILLLVALSTSLPLFASSTEYLDFRLKILSGGTIDNFYGVRWKKSTPQPDGPVRDCQLAQARPHADILWQNTGSEDCEILRTFLSRNANALAEYDPQLKKHAYPVSRHLGVISYPAGKLYADLSQHTRCDITLAACKAPALNAPTQLALQIQTIVTRRLGYMAAPEAPAE